MLFSKLRSENLALGMSKGLAKFWMMLASIAVAINLFLILTLMQMAPKLQMIAQILTVSPLKSNQLLQVEPFTRKISDRELVDETLLRYYMEMRHSSFPDEIEMQYRWGGGGPVARLSSTDIYQKFSQNLEDKINAAVSKNKTVSVDIVSISRIDNIFTIEFDVYQYEQNTIISKRKMATVAIDYRNGRRFFNREGYSNPFGFYVWSYDETEKKR